MESLLPNQPKDDRISIKVIDDRNPSTNIKMKKNKIVIRNDSKKKNKVNNYHKWRTKRVDWIYIDDLMKSDEFMFECFIRLPFHVNEKIYSFVPSKPSIDYMYGQYFKSQLQIKQELNNDYRTLGIALSASRIITQHCAYMMRLKQRQLKVSHFWKHHGFVSKSTPFPITLIIKNKTKRKIWVNWIDYDGNEQQNAEIYSDYNVSIGAYVGHTFVIRTQSLNENVALKWNNLCIVGLYQIRSTYPSHIVTVSSLKRIYLNIGSPLKSVPIVFKDYNECVIEGFRVRYEADIFEKFPKLHDILTCDLRKMNENINESILKIMKKKSIWLNIKQEIGHIDGRNVGFGLSYHCDKETMAKNGVMPQKYRSIEVYSVTDYMEWRVCQPLILFHEFVHSFHCYIGRERRDIIDCYNTAMDKGLYDVVLHYPKEGIVVNQRAYAATNCFEYFAQMSEAYFGACNYYPFNRHQLKQHDPDAFLLCEKIWTHPDYD